MQLTALPIELKEIVRNTLQSNENIIWLYQPNAWEFARASQSIGIVGFVITAIVLAVLLNRKLNTGTMVIIIVLGIFSAFLTIFPLLRYKDGRRTAYFITNQRAISIDGGVVKIYPADKIKFIKTETQSNQQGTIRISDKPFSDAESNETDVIEELWFEYVAHPIAVENMLKKLGKL